MHNLWLDVKYAGLLSVQLEKYKLKQQNPYLSNFRCPICGDSDRSKNKARGYLYTKASSLFYKCHNCGAGLSLPNLMKLVNRSLYDQYTMERYKEGLDLHSVNKPKYRPDFKFEAPKFKKKSMIDKLFTKMDELPDDNPGVQYLELRKIPRAKFDSLYYIDDMQKVEQLSKKYEGKIIGNEARIGIPFYDRQNNLVALSCRAIDDNKMKHGISLRYLTDRLDEDAPLIYNLNEMDTTKAIYCVEGPIDSLFLPNCIAVGSSDLNKVESHIPKSITTLVFDNQPRNPEIVRIMYQAMEKDYNVAVWSDNIAEKDINEMVLSGKTPDEILTSINKSTFNGLSLRLKLNEWSKC